MSRLTRDLAEEISRFHPDPKVTARVCELAAKSDGGTLTDDERRELEAYVDAGDIIALLRVKARRLLASCEIK